MLFLLVMSLMQPSFQVLVPHFLFPVTHCFGVEEALMALGSPQDELPCGDRQDEGPTAAH